MDVRCEKCQTEYELDEQRLKPGGVTVKCTNCGHMFKIRKRTPTNVGGPAQDRPRLPSTGMPTPPPAERSLITGEHGATERQWSIRLENGEQKSCRELATLQQWIVGNIVSRESLISRTGKTWKRLGDIAELAQYFEIADEARMHGSRATKNTGKAKDVPGTMLGIGVGAAPSAAGGTILPDDDEGEARTTGNFAAVGRPSRPSTQPPPVPHKVVSAKTPPMGSNASATDAGIDPGTDPTGPTLPARRPVTTPPPPPAKRTPTGPVPTAKAKPATTPPVPSAQPDSRSTGLWANEPVKITGVEPSSPFVGKLSAIPDEPAFAGRVRVSPSDESSFDTGRVRSIDDDDDMLPARRGSRAGLVILVMMLLVGAGAAAIIYLFVLKKDEGNQMPATIDAGVVVVTPDATLVVTPVPPVVDAAPEAPAPTALETARAELASDHEARLRASLETLPKDDPATQIMRAQLGAAIAQALMDRAGLVADKTEADKLRKEARTIVLDAATAAQRAHKATPDDAGANLAMANVLRLQGKPAKDLKRYSDVAKTSTHPGSWARDAAYADALVLARDGKLEDAKAAFAAIDQGDGKLEVSNDVRARFHLALVALAQNRAADAKVLADQVLAAQPEHAGARALVAKLETKVTNTDPLPPEEPGKGSAGTGTGSGKVTPPPPDVTAGGGSYDQLLARANKLAEGNCTKALELYAKALEQKPNGVEALTGMGYCHIDAKQFASAFSKFRAALAVSPRFEPALWGVAEAYQQQGRREQALEAYKAYLEVYPNSEKAKKQVDRLGGGATPPTGSATPPDGSGTTPTPTPPTPTPTPEAPGSGSG